MSNNNKFTSPIKSFQAGVGSVGTTAAKLDNAINLKAAKKVVIKNTHATQQLYVGKLDVSNSTPFRGYELGENEKIELEVEDPSQIFVVGSSAATTYTWYSI